MVKSDTADVAHALQDAICAKYAFTREAIEFVSYSQTYVFRVVSQGMPLIVRAIEPDHRTKQEILSELDWIAHLKNGGAKVCGIETVAGRDACETIQAQGREYSCVLFEHAPGSSVTGEDLSPSLFEQHGKLLGQLHRLTVDYDSPAWSRRGQWHESRLYSRDAEEYVLPEQPRIVEVLRELLAEGMSLPKRARNFGLVHLDLHYNNLFLDSGTPYLFDCDNCAYGFFANDIAKALHGSVLTYHRRKEGTDDSLFESPLIDQALAEVWGPFWHGYRSEFEPEPEVFETLPLFFMLVDIHDYVHHHRHGTPNRSPQIKAAFRKMQDRIEKRILPVQFDFVNGKPLLSPVKLT